MPCHSYPKRSGRRTDTLKPVVVDLSPKQFEKLERLANMKQTTPDQLAEEVVQNYLIDQRVNAEPNQEQREIVEAQLMGSSLDQ